MTKTLKKKVPFVLLSRGPTIWRSFDQILPCLCQVWLKNGVREVGLWMPNPTLSRQWLEDARYRTQCLIFPPGSLKYNGLRILSYLRTKVGLRVPAIIMATTNQSAGIRRLAKYQDILTNKDCIVVNCTAEKRLLTAAFSNQAKVVSIPLPLAEVRGRPSTKKIRQQKKLGLGFDPKNPLIIYAGRITVQKNIHALLWVFSHVLKTLPKAQLSILGEIDNVGLSQSVSSEGNYAIALTKLINRLGIGHAVRFEGHLDQKDLKEFFLACDAQVSLTVFPGEDFGYSIAQGLGFGVPTLVTAWGGGLDFVRGGGAMGIPVQVTGNGPRVDFIAAHLALIDLLDPEKNQVWRRRALRYAQEYLSIDSVQGAWAQVFSELKRGPGQPLTIATEFLRPGILSNAPKDPLYLKFLTEYAGLPKNKVSKLSPSATYYIHPLFRIHCSSLFDRTVPSKNVSLTLKERKEILSVFGNTHNSLKLVRGIHISKYGWAQLLYDQGILLTPFA